MVRPRHYDPALEFWECHGRPEDVLLHPRSADFPAWDLADEIRSPIDARAMATSFLPDRREGSPDFWDQAPHKLLSFLLSRLAEAGQDIGDLLGWLAELIA